MYFLRPFIRPLEKNYYICITPFAACHIDKAAIVPGLRTHIEPEFQGNSGLFLFIFM